tara:strand:+ start:7595 stop:8956 length:1362 start_codon:yes stop_codon:yes gene_type:complete
MLRVAEYLNKQVNIAPLVTFRIIFGALMLFSTVRFWYLGWIENHFIEPTFHFKYFGFYWVEPLSPTGMYVVHTIMILAALGIMLGAMYRLSAILFFLGFTYCELIDLTYYLNHYYFVSIAALVMVFLPASNYFSIDQKVGWVKEKKTTEQWAIWLLKYLIGLVYFYAGIAKMNPSWLFEAMPLRIWLPANNDMPFIGWTFNYPVTAYLFSWAGMLYDTFIPFLLLWRKTRSYAWFAVLGFHTVTGYLFQIGVFPIVMTFVTLIFFSNQFHEKIIGVFKKGMAFLPAIKAKFRPLWNWNYQLKPVGMILLFTFVIFQFVFPWRFLLYPGNLFWNEEGFRFSWRVMLVEKAGTAQFYVKDAKTGREGMVINSEFLNPHQEKQMAFQPDMILQFAHFLAEEYEKRGVENPEVRCEAYVTLNGRPSKLIVDPTVNLATINDSFKHKTWILPYENESN